MSCKFLISGYAHNSDRLMIDYNRKSVGLAS